MIRVTWTFSWHDLWVGARYDHDGGALFVAPLPGLVLVARVLRPTTRRPGIKWEMLSQEIREE